MAFHDDFYDLQAPGGYGFMDMGSGHSYYGREPYREAAPGMYRHGHSEPYFDNYRRDYRRGGGYADGRFGVLPPEEVIHRVDPDHWTDDGYRHGGYRGGHRSDYHGGQHYGRGNFRHNLENYDRGDHHVPRLQEVELYVPLCCDKCERRLRKDLQYMPGVENITMDQTSKRVVVVGNVNPSYVLERARLNKPESEFWHPGYR